MAMRYFCMSCLVLIVTSASLAASEREAGKTHQVRLNGHTFTLPVGFDIELAAGPPLVDRPIAMDFDEEGRLYVTDSSGSNEPVQEQLKKKPHRVVRLEDTTGSGRFDKRTVFADKLMFPEGCLWYAGSLYVAAPPSIWKLTDTKGAGAADQRVEWFQGKTLTGCANDLHGPYLGPDGWIYWCKGAFEKQTYPRPGRPPFVTRAAHIFRSRPDGSGIEPVMTGGMDNPVNVAFTPSGERVFTCTFLQFPGGGRRDGLIHAIYGGIYGKDWDVIHESSHKWTGPAVMPVLTHLGAAAPCGLIRYESRVFGPEYQDNFFACLFNMQKVTRHVLVPQGSTFTTRDEDLLLSDNKDFHPTDVKEDADGSLLVVDTGGWYKLCCPTSQLVKPDVLGAIYRIRRHDAPRVEDPRGLKLDWTKLQANPKQAITLLDDPRPAVRKRAVQALVARAAIAIEAIAGLMKQSSSAEVRRNAIWAATQIDAPRARDVVRFASLGDGDESVRQAALESVSLWRDRHALAGLLQTLKHSSPANRRLAAEALGRIGDRSAAAALLEAASRPSDRALEHALIFALIEIADPKQTASGLNSAHPGTRRAALIALDQMDQGRLEAAVVIAELTSPDPALKEAAWWIAGRHPEWGGALVKFLRERLDTQGMTAAQREVWAAQLARFARSAAVQELLAERLGDRTGSPDARHLVLRAMAQSGVKQTPDSWRAALTRALSHEDAELLRSTVAAVRALPMPKNPPPGLGAALVQVAHTTRLPAELRLEALAAVPGSVEIDAPLFALLRTHVSAEQAVAARTAATEVLARAKLTSEQLVTLADSLKAVGPMEINRLVETFGQSADAGVGQHLLVALKSSPARTALRRDALKTGLAKASPPLQQQAHALYAELNVDSAKQQARLEQLLASTRDGDVRRGQAVFNSTKAACSSCHAIGYLGGTIGPDLTHIARIRSDRDLLEAIAFPSASFVRGYEPVVVTTRDGKVHNGLMRHDASDEIVLTLGANQEIRIPRADIEDVQPSRISIMPAGLDQQLTLGEFADLLAFLKACK
jgi:putative membrane-bound dehydrogenase-like protein